MPKIGEIKRASEVGYSGRSRLIWDACPDCGKQRWQYIRLKGTRCCSCAAQLRARKYKPTTFTGTGLPQLGDIAQAKILGYTGRALMIFAPCPNCGIGHWVRLRDKNNLCIHCVPKLVGSNHPRWSNGRKTKRGYIYVRVNADDPMRAMADRSVWVLEHRLVVANRIGRPLQQGEIVHHINGIKSDNRDCNLQLLIESKHHSHLVTKALQSRMCALEARVLSLESENILLRVQLGSMSIPSQAGEKSPGVCRGLTGDTLEDIRGEEKVHSLEKSGAKVRSIRRHRFPHNEHQSMVSPLGNKRVNCRLIRGTLKSIDQGNPELSSGEKPDKCVETIDLPSQVDEEIVHPSGKLEDKDA